MADVIADLWEKACERLVAELGRDQYERWFSLVRPDAFDGKTFTLAVENEFSKMWLEKNYVTVVHDALCALGAPADVEVAFKTVEGSSPAASAPEVKPADAHQTEASPSVPIPPPVTPAPRATTAGELNPDFTFENFVTGPANNWAYNAACETARKPGRAYNPLFIYGPTGIGKTHLMQAIGHAIKENSPQLKVRYVTCEAMLNDYVSCVQRKEDFVNFRRRYRGIDVLLVDDIQMLTGKEALQEEFFNTYNELHSRKKQIVMTSDLPPAEIAGLPERLVSRFSEGLTTQIELPKFETRLAILKYKQLLSGVQLSDDAISFIANNISSSVRALEGALTRTISYLAMRTGEAGGGGGVTADELRVILKDLLDAEQQRDFTCEEIQRAVVEHFNLTMKDMTSEGRPRSIAEPRQLAMFLCRKLTNKSSGEIAAAFEKTHPTVCHAVTKINGRIKLDAELAAATEAIVRKLGRTMADLADNS